MEKLCFAATYLFVCLFLFVCVLVSIVEHNALVPTLALPEFPHIEPNGPAQPSLHSSSPQFVPTMGGCALQTDGSPSYEEREGEGEGEKERN